MSKYANYAVASENYDSTRIPVGVETILEILGRTDVPLGKQTVLEAGCGTGNYLQALSPHLGRVVGVDYSEGMLEQARAKLGEDIELTCGSIMDLPYDEDRFDGITCNQVVHHLDEGPGMTDDPAAWQPSDFPNITRFIEEAHRVLRPGGVLVINATTHAQFVDGYWWADLIPVAVSRLTCRMPDLEQMKDIFVAAGFEIESVVADLDGILQGASYLEPEGPLREAWRAGDSTWSLASDDELTSALRRVEQMLGDDTMQAYLAQREEQRQGIGQSTFFVGRK